MPKKPKLKILVSRPATCVTLKPDEMGSIAHYVKIENGRVTFMKDSQFREGNGGIPVNVAATVEEVEKVRLMLDTLIPMMKASLPKKTV